MTGTRLPFLIGLAAVAGCDAAPSTPAPPPLVGRACTTVQGRTAVLEFSEVSPEIIGGLGALRSRAGYPEADRLAGTQGTVVVQFVVEATGLACDPVVARGVSPGLDRAAFVAVQEVRFTPGRQDGRAVAVRMSVPVRFVLPDTTATGTR